MAKSFTFNPFTGNFDAISTVTLSAVGASPNANGAVIDPVTQVLILEPADGTNPGLLTASSQTIGGAKTLTSALNLSSQLINSVADPVSAQDAATKNYVDAAVAALNPATAVNAASTANIAGTYANGASGVGATFTTTATGTFTIDGVTPALGARVLLKDQSSGFQNGVYKITVLGTTGVSTVFTRATDYNTAADMNTAGLIPVIAGTVNALSSWQQVATITSVGTDALVFTEFTANPSLYLLKANNLSDLASASTSFGNISPLTTKGDVLAFGSSNARLAVGSNNQVLTADSAQTLGVKWATPTTGTVTSVSVTTANGVSGSVANPTTTPAITLTLGAITPTSVNGNTITTGTGTLTLSTFTLTVAATASISGTNTGDITLGAVGSSPSANGASLSAQVLTLQPFDSTHPGVVPLSGGGTAKFLRADATWAVPAAAGIAPTIQKFTSSSGTYTTPANVVYIHVRLVGGGGGGGSSTGGDGGTGGTTTFGTSLLSGSGGTGGGGSGGGAGAGGAASLGTGPIGVAFQGGGGSAGLFMTTGNFPAGSSGGASPFGGAGKGGSAGGAGGAAVANTGSGGGGGAGGSGSTSGGSGGAGGYVDAIITSPSATYAYAVGAAGTAGVAGGQAGGLGGSGFIIVTEHY